MTTQQPGAQAAPADIRAQVEAILQAATLEEKVAMMSGRGFFEAFMADGGLWGGRPYQAGGGCERLGAPTFYFTDGPRGVARGESTCFPVPMARGASFDTDLERRIGEAMGAEIRAQGCNLSGAVCINLLRHPAWGRAQETYGEDMHHLGEMGAALSEGLQVHNVAATVKHFAANSIENARFKVDVQMSERVLREIYLPHFKRVIDAGCMTVMSAYNKVNGEYCGQHRELLTDILRHEWGFEGVVHSDWVMGVYAPYGAAAGLDIENPEPIHFGQKLIDAVTNGQIEPAVVDTACRRILTVLYTIGTAEDPLDDYPETLVANDRHIALAREAAVKSAVLLKNDGPVLPLKPGARVAVAGALADTENIGDGGSSRVRPPYITTPLAGLRAALGDDQVTHAGDERDPQSAAKAAAGADLAIVVVGFTAEDEGEFIPGEINLGQAAAAIPEGVRDMAKAEGRGKPKAPVGGDRDQLGLKPDQVALIKAVAKANPNTLVVIEAGSAVIVRDWIDAVPAALQIFYPGMEGGSALADFITGAASPSGKLPFTMARKAGDYPFFDKDADAITYDLWHGYAKFDREGLTPEFPFGHGLSYTRFSYRGLKARLDPKGDIAVEVSVANTGACAADEVVQLYVSPPGQTCERWARQLKGFARVTLEPGERKTVRLTLRRDDLSYFDEAVRDWRVEPGEHRLLVGGSSAPDALIGICVRL